MVNDYHVHIAAWADEDALEGVNALLPQLSPEAQPLTPSEFKEICDHNFLLLAMRGDTVVGMLTLCQMLTPTGRKWRVEDVVVDNAHRGHGLGRTLMEETLKTVANNGGGHVELTSRPSRIAANALYQKLGFRRKETNVYVMDIQQDQ